MKINIEKIIKNTRISFFISLGYVCFFSLINGHGAETAFMFFGNLLITSIFLFLGLVSYDFCYPDEKT